MKLGGRNGRIVAVPEIWNDMKNVNRQAVLVLLDKIKESGGER